MIVVALASLLSLPGVAPMTVRAATNCTTLTGKTPFGIVHVNSSPGDTITVSSPTPYFITANLLGGTDVFFLDPGVPYTITDCSKSSGGIPGPLFSDSRLNNRDGYETSAIYCLGDGSVRVYVIGSPNWTIDFDASPAEIAKVPKNPAHNTLIKKGKFAALWRLAGGSLQINSPGLNPKDGEYIFIFADCALPAVQK